MSLCMFIPCAIALATNLGVDNVQSRLAGKVLEILYIEVRPSPNPDIWGTGSTQNKALGVPGPGVLGPNWERGKSKDWGV